MAAGVIRNISFGGLSEVEHLVEQGCIKAMVDLLSISDAKIVGEALESLENILTIGVEKQQEIGMSKNPFALLVEQAAGLAKIKMLHEDPSFNEDVYQKAIRILDNFFPVEASAW